jgi:hypothetical protein
MMAGRELIARFGPKAGRCAKRVSKVIEPQGQTRLLGNDLTSPGHEPGASMSHI